MNNLWRALAVPAPAIRDTVGHRWRRLAIAGCLSLWGVVACGGKMRQLRRGTLSSNGDESGRTTSEMVD